MLARFASSATVVWVVLGACAPATEYPCDVDGQCLDGSVMGMCQSPGWCSFPDGECPSGQRYGDLAGGGLARMCVPVEGSTTGVGDDAPTTLPTASETTTEASGSDSLSTTNPITSGVDVTGEGSTTHPESTTTSSTPGTTGDGSTGGPPECATYVDDFEDGVVGAEWDVYLADLISEEAGARVFVVSTDPRDGYPTTALAQSQDLTQGWVRARVGVPPAHAQEQLFLTVSPVADTSDVVHWFLEGDLLIARRQTIGQGAWIDIFETAFDPDLHRWLQIRGDDATLHFEVAGEDEAFAALASYDLEYTVDDMFVGMSAGNWGVIDLVAELSFEHFEVCSP
jgi:hypothetical protein